MEKKEFDNSLDLIAQLGIQKNLDAPKLITLYMPLVCKLLFDIDTSMAKIEENLDYIKRNLP